ncbi:hypothetical protein F2P56_034136, partial [Juglans regia]
LLPSQKANTYKSLTISSAFSILLLQPLSATRFGTNSPESALWDQKDSLSFTLRIISFGAFRSGSHLYPHGAKRVFLPLLSVCTKSIGNAGKPVIFLGFKAYRNVARDLMESELLVGAFSVFISWS